MIQFLIWVGAVLLGLTIGFAVPALLALAIGGVIDRRDRQIPVDSDIHELCQ